MTREALAYVATITRDRSIFSLDPKPETDLDETTQSIDTEKSSLRQVKLMKLLEKSEIPQPSTSADQPADADRGAKHEEQL